MTDSVFQAELAELSRMYRTMEDWVNQFVVGHQPLIHLIAIAILSEGHVLIEGAPGTAKTIIAKTMARLSGCQFRRVQGAVDTQPADIIGVRIYDSKEQDFILKEGPIFSNFVLIDEINRLSPRTQSAFVEAMSEGQATIDGITREFKRPFFVIATQNPYEYEGTFPVIEAQKDRFMFSTRLSHLNPTDELEVIERADRGELQWNIFSQHLTPVTNAEAILRSHAIVQKIHIEPSLREYIRNIVVATRSHSDIRLGASARASIAFVQAGKAKAAMEKRGYVIPDDIKQMALPILQHRLLLTREAAIRGVATDQVIQEIVENIEVP